MDRVFEGNFIGFFIRLQSSAHITENTYRKMTKWIVEINTCPLRPLYTFPCETHPNGECFIRF